MNEEDPAGRIEAAIETRRAQSPTYAIAHGSAAVQAAKNIAGVAKEDDLRERIRHLRDERNIGLLEAKRIVLREDLIADINAAETIDDIKALLLRIV